MKFLKKIIKKDGAQSNSTVRKGEDIRSLPGMIASAAARKRRAAEVRFGKETTTAEVSRDVFLYACDKIADSLTCDGYRYARSGPRVTRKHGPFTFHIGFGSSHYNIAGELVVLDIGATVRSQKFKQWRAVQKNTLRVGDGIAGGHLGNLRPESGWLEWNLADKKEREDIIDEIIRLIREIAFPYFEQFEDLPSLIKKLITEEIREFDVAKAIEFLLCFGDRDMALGCGWNFFKRRPDIIQSYRVMFDRFKRDGLPERASGYAGELAFLSLAHDLQFLD